MNPFKKIISASLSPNTEANDVFRAMNTLFRPWSWKEGSSIGLVERWFERKFPHTTAISFNSGRSALLAIFNAFGIGEGDEVLLQSFTCVAVPNSALWAGATPVFVDIDESLNIDVRDAARKVTPKTRALIVQHTLGVPADMDAISAFVKKHNLLLIEDCAHSLGAQYKNQQIGSFGDAAFFSFGRDKVISSVFGGLAIIPERYKKQTDQLHTYQSELAYPSNDWIFQQLLHPILFSVILPLYNTGIGKGLLYISQRLKLLSFPVYSQEKRGEKPHDFPKKYPNALAYLLELQLTKLEKLNAQRKNIVSYYYERLDKKSFRFIGPKEGAIYLRFPMRVSEPKNLLSRAKKSGILLGNWYHNTVDPTGVQFEKIGYQYGSCPMAEKMAKDIINLPTLISKKEALQIVELFQ